MCCFVSDLQSNTLPGNVPQRKAPLGQLLTWLTGPMNQLENKLERSGSWSAVCLYSSLFQDYLNISSLLPHPRVSPVSTPEYCLNDLPDRSLKYALKCRKIAEQKQKSSKLKLVRQEKICLF